MSSWGAIYRLQSTITTSSNIIHSPNWRWASFTEWSTHELLALWVCQQQLLRQKARMKAIVSFQTRRHTATAQPCQTASFPQSWTMEKFPGICLIQLDQKLEHTTQHIQQTKSYAEYCQQAHTAVPRRDMQPPITGQRPKKVVHGPPMLFHFEW